MLRIEIPLSREGWDEKKEEFVPAEVCVLDLEHSLVSISEWESKWNKPFLSKADKTDEETLDYVKCMTVTRNVDPAVYDHLTRDNVRAITEYIQAPRTATVVRDDKNARTRREIVTSEVIYGWMIALNIPLECQHWHLNRLITLVKVCNAMNAPPKKMSKRDTTSRYAALNAARRRRLNSRG